MLLWFPWKNVDDYSILRPASSQLRRLCGGAESGILPHSPQAASIHLPVNPTCIRVLSRSLLRNHDREILRAFRKLVTPKYSIRSVQKVAIRNRSRSPVALLAGALWNAMKLRIAPEPNNTAKHRKKKPITSFHKVRAGLMTVGATCFTNSRPARAFKVFHTPSSYHRALLPYSLSFGPRIADCYYDLRL